MNPHSLYFYFAISGGVIILSGLLMIPLQIYIAKKHLNTMLSHLKNCQAITLRAPLLNMGWKGKVLMTSSIASFLMFPKYLTKKGMLDNHDIGNFPVKLKKILVITHSIDLALLVGLCIVGLALKILEKPT